MWCSLQCVKREMRDVCCCHWPCCIGSDDENSFGDSVSLEEQKPRADDHKVSRGSTSIEYALISVPQEENEVIESVESVIDPDEAYIKNFESLGAYNQLDDRKHIIRPDKVEEMVTEAESILTSASLTELTPRDVVQGLNAYTRSISLTEDLETKARYIQRYEEHKNDLDQDNKDERDKAEFYLQNARNMRTPSQDRIQYYQTAIKFTNNMIKKEEIRAEYRLYYFTYVKNKD